VGCISISIIHLHSLVLRLFVEEIFVVGLLGWVWSKQARPIRIPAPDRRPIRSEQLLEFGIEARRIRGKVEQCISFFRQLFAQFRDLARQLAIIRVIELRDTAVGGRARGRQSKAETLRYLSNGRIMRTEDANPARPVPAPYAMLEIQCQIVLGAHGDAWVSMMSMMSVSDVDGKDGDGSRGVAPNRG
jgi:hypothetical protein